jgi:hypothetical protein
MPRQKLIATALLVGISMLAMAAVIEFYSEDVRSDCLGPNCEIGYAYQKTWTKVWYDNSARKVVSHTGAAVIDSKGLYGYVVEAQGHPYIAGCVGDPWSGYGWMRIDYDRVDWYFLGIYAITWYTQSSIEVYAC